VGGDSIVLYVMELQTGDRLALDMTVLSGDLNPHISFFYGTSSYISSDSWNRDGNVLHKEYTAEYAGVYSVAARAYHNEGDGDFSLTATCLGGPCAGEFPDPVEELMPDEVNDCIMEARICAFDRLPRYHGSVGPSRSQFLFQECLSEQSTSEGISCSGVCGLTDICDRIIGMLPYYADQTAECVDVLENCMITCYDAGDIGSGHYGGEEYDDIAEVMCLDGPLGGYCDAYASDHTLCGGEEYGPDTYAECQALCQTTTGAWIDDLDTLCDEECEGLCDQAQEECNVECDYDPECYHLCMYEMAYDCE
jgi:hypothetical protein